MFAPLRVQPTPNSRHAALDAATGLGRVVIDHYRAPPAARANPTALGLELLCHLRERDAMPPLNRDEEVGVALRELFRDGGTLILQRPSADDEYELSFSRHGQHLAGLMRDDLRAVLTAALNRETRKVCRGECGQAKAPEQFGRDRNAKDGRLSRCRVCEKARVMAWDDAWEKEHGRRRPTRG